jgi:hypothetical protein
LLHVTVPVATTILDLCPVAPASARGARATTPANIAVATAARAVPRNLLLRSPRTAPVSSGFTDTRQGPWSRRLLRHSLGHGERCVPEVTAFLLVTREAKGHRRISDVVLNGCTCLNSFTLLSHPRDDLRDPTQSSLVSQTNASARKENSCVASPSPSSRVVERDNRFPCDAWKEFYPTGSVRAGPWQRLGIESATLMSVSGT